MSIQLFTAATPWFSGEIFYRGSLYDHRTLIFSRHSAGKSLAKGVLQQELPVGFLLDQIVITSLQSGVLQPEQDTDHTV